MVVSLLLLKLSLLLLLLLLLFPGVPLLPAPVQVPVLLSPEVCTLSWLSR